MTASGKSTFDNIPCLNIPHIIDYDEVPGARFRNVRSMLQQSKTVCSKKNKGNTLLKPSENVGNVCRQAGIMLFP
jgi:hypothetical protein